MKDRIQYGYDRAGNRTWRKNLVAPENQDQHYLYDPLYQVTEAARGNLNLNQTAIGGIPAQLQTITFDPTGNWDRYTTSEGGVEVLDQTRIHNQANQITQIDGSNTGLLYDRAGNATQMPPNAAGDWSQHYKLTWDAWNRLVKVEDQDDEVVASYANDGTTRQTAKTTEEGVMHTYYNEKWKAVEERADDSSDPHLQYLWGSRPNHRDELVRRDRDADDTGPLEEKLYCLMDYFDPTSVTDEEGNIEERYQFGAFGLRLVTDAEWTTQFGSDFDFQFGFHGQFLDPETQYYNYGYRYYCPNVGRWPSRDPFRESGGINFYAFSYNSSINLHDYYGLKADLIKEDPATFYVKPFVLDDFTFRIFLAQMASGEGFWGKTTNKFSPPVATSTRTGWLPWTRRDEVMISVPSPPTIEASYFTSTLPAFLALQKANGITDADTIAHERVHVGISIKWWNLLVGRVNAYEGTWKPCGCGPIVVDIVAALGNLYFKNIAIENAQYHVSLGQEPASRVTQLIAERLPLVEALHTNTEALASKGCMLV